MSIVRFHPAFSCNLRGMNAPGGVAPPPGKTKFALGYFPAEHHGTADKQGSAADRTQRGCIASGMPISAATGGQAGPRGGQYRHCLSFIDEAA
jgi:hypothetical protein